MTNYWLEKSEKFFVSLGFGYGKYVFNCSSHDRDTAEELKFLFGTVLREVDFESAMQRVEKGGRWFGEICINPNQQWAGIMAVKELPCESMCIQKHKKTGKIRYMQCFFDGFDGCGICFSKNDIVHIVKDKRWDEFRSSPHDFRNELLQGLSHLARVHFGLRETQNNICYALSVDFVDGS